MTAPIACDDCHRPVVVGPVLRDGDGGKYGPRCGRAHGLRPPRAPQVRRPEREGIEQPVLAGLDENEINEESGDNMTYIREAIDAVNAELPGLDPELVPSPIADEEASDR